MKVVYTSVVDEILLVIEEAKQLNKRIDSIVLTEKEALEYYTVYTTLFEIGEFRNFSYFKNKLLEKGFYHCNTKLIMEK